MELVADIELEEGIVIAPLLKNEDTFESWVEVLPFYSNVIKDGVVLVEKKD